MRIHSEAGEFDIRMNDLVVEGDDVIIKGKLAGLYPAKVLHTPSDLVMVIRHLVRPRVLLYLLMLPFYLLSGALNRQGKG